MLVLSDIDLLQSIYVCVADIPFTLLSAADLLSFINLKPVLYVSAHDFTGEHWWN